MEAESPDYAPLAYADESRPSIGFPLGTALLLIIIFCLSGVFSCCYHWDKFKSFRRSLSDVTEDHEGDIEKAKIANMSSKQNQSQSLSVLMPGDQIPKFIAMPCPSEPRRPLPEKNILEVKKQPEPPRQKPPRMAVPFLLTNYTINV